MSKTSRLDELIQELDTLSLEQLLEVKKKVDMLIQGKIFKNPNPNAVAHYSKSSLARLGQWRVAERAYIYEIKSSAKPGAGESNPLARLLQDLERDYILAINEDSPKKDVDAEGETLEDAIKLVEEWMSDESGYDEETYPQIEAALNQNRLSF